MLRKLRTFRLLLTCSLLAAFGLTGVFPQYVVLAGAGVQAERERGSTTCCCGLPDDEGRCCGMLCCLAQQPPPRESLPSPTENDSRDGRTNPLARATSKPFMLGDSLGQGSSSGLASSAAYCSLHENSLQALHVRIDA